MKNTKTQKKNRADFQTRFKVGHKGYKGSLNGTWKGDKAGYVAIHSWLKSNVDLEEIGMPDEKRQEISLKGKEVEVKLDGKVYKAIIK